MTHFFLRHASSSFALFLLGTICRSLWDSPELKRSHFSFHISSAASAWKKSRTCYMLNVGIKEKTSFLKLRLYLLAPEILVDDENKQ